MQKLTSLALILLLCALTACGGNSAGTPGTEGSSGPEQSTGDGAASPEDGENPEGWTAYDCGGVQIALPDEYLDQLDVVTDPAPSGVEGYTNLLTVREKASVEAAERDFGTSEDVGILFTFARMDQAAYDAFKEADGYGFDFFAQDGEDYYVRVTPSNLQIYRGEAIDQESEDWKNWETLLALGEPIQQDMIRRNGLAEMKK